METQLSFKTQRLLIESLSISDNNFILELVNTDEWIKFIGNRNITSQAEATAYIQKIIDNPSIVYWVVKLHERHTKIGIVTFIKRDYLEHHDIGFAFLPNYFNKGYAFEATVTVLNNVKNIYNLSTILATTVPDNIGSIKLLEKLGLNYKAEIEVGSGKLLVYEAFYGRVRGQ